MGCGFVAVVPDGARRRGDRRCSPRTTPARAGSAPSPPRPGACTVPGPLLVGPGLARVRSPDRRRFGRGRRAGHAVVGLLALPVLARVGDLLAELLGPLLPSRRASSARARSSRSGLPVFLLRARALGELLAQIGVLVRAPLVRVLLGRQIGIAAPARARRARAGPARSAAPPSRDPPRDPRLPQADVADGGARARARTSAAETWSDELPSIVLIVPSAPTDSTTPMCSSQTIRSPGCGCTPGPFGTALPARWAQA